MGDVMVGHAELSRFVAAVFSATGLSINDAETMARMLVWANERGVDSHGVIRIPIYLAEIKKGLLNPNSKPTIRDLLPATFAMDCNRAPGPVCMMRAAQHAMERANQFGIGVGLLSDPHHLGAIGHYAQRVAECGYAGMIILGGLPFMAYHGAKVAGIGTSPIAIGVPGPDPDGPPVLLDMATSVAAAGRIRQAAAEGNPIPPGIALDADGKPTTDPLAAVTLLPIGGAKGSGLSFMFECL